MNEVLFTSSSGDAVVSVNVWDSKTGTNIMSYRGGGIMNPKGLSLLGSDYLIGVEKSKPLLQVWPINSQQPLHSPRLLCPGKISVMSCSPDSCYIAIAVDEKLHIYQVSSGCLVGSGVRHFQSITVIRWSYEGSILACGGEDGMITVWSLSSLLNKESLQIASEPRYIFNDHSLPVTDLNITCGGSSCFRSRLISVSSDRTAKIYDLATGKVLLSIIFTEMLTSVAVSPSEMELFVGCTSGDVNQFSLRNPKNVNSSEIHISSGILNSDKNITSVFSGHKKSITCLSVSIDGERLLSGSLDESVRIWHIISKQCLKILNLKGPVTNAFFIIAPKQMLEQDVKRNVVLCPFQKTQVSNDEDNEFCLEIINYNDLDISLHDVSGFEHSLSMSFALNDFDNDASAKDEVKRLRSINEKLYRISMEQLLQKRIDEDAQNDSVDSDKNSNNVSNKNNVIDNIFDNLIVYQKQPALRNKIKKKKKKNLVEGKRQTDDIDLISMKSRKKLHKKRKNKSKCNK